MMNLMTSQGLAQTHFFFSIINVIEQKWMMEIVCELIGTLYLQILWLLGNHLQQAHIYELLSSLLHPVCS
jgi:hypothetical protein